MKMQKKKKKEYAVTKLHKIVPISLMNKLFENDRPKSQRI